jgi:hypothetical protein
MMRRWLLIGCMLLAAQVRAQDLRLESLGAMRYGLDDPRATLSLYRFGHNPAWMLREETTSWLSLTPQIGDRWGEYRRIYDPGHVTTYGAGFEGVKPLGSRGTFHGAAAYSMEERSSVNRSLKRTPYAGEAYFLTDTTNGSFTYKGPSVSFAYAYELFPGFLIGGDIGYALQDGLKDLPTNAKTLFRRIQGTAGIAYDAGSGLAIGVTVHPFDEQERINCDREDLLDVEVYRYRGESFSRIRRDSEVNQTVRLTGEEYSVQAEWAAENGLSVGVVGRAGISRTRDLIEMGTVSKDFEDGFAQRTWYNAEARLRMRLAPQLIAGCGVSRHEQREWSTYPAMDLLVWDATGSETILGAGASLGLSEAGGLIALEAEYAFVHADSSKHIDHRFTIVRTGEIRVRTGVEVPISGIGTLRAAYGFGSMGRDVRRGGNDVTEHTVSAGAALPLGKSMHLEWLTRYTHRTNSASALRDDITTMLLLRLTEF